MAFSELQYQAEIRRLQDRVTTLEFALRGREQELNIARLTVDLLARERLDHELEYLAYEREMIERAHGEAIVENRLH